MKNLFLRGVPVDDVLQRFRAAPGNEIETGKFASPESSALLAANAFGFFLNRAADFPRLPIDMDVDWPPVHVLPEEEIRFPWSGGTHPWLDAVLETPSALIGVESKRYEPFRSKARVTFSNAYWRPKWGDEMTRFMKVRDGLRDGAIVFERLDATQLIKHAFGLRTAVHREGDRHGKTPALLYLYCEPDAWPDGRSVANATISTHRSEVERFAELVDGDEVAFRACSYRQMLNTWLASGVAEVRDHANAVAKRFAI